MMTIVSHITIEPGKEPGWDAAFRERLAAVKDQPGWVAVQLSIPAHAVNKRVVISATGERPTTLKLEAREWDQQVTRFIQDLPR